MSKQLEKRTCKFCEEPLRRIHPGNIVDWVHTDYSYRCWAEELTEAWQRDRAELNA